MQSQAASFLPTEHSSGKRRFFVTPRNPLPDSLVSDIIGTLPLVPIMAELLTVIFITNTRFT